MCRCARAECRNEWGGGGRFGSLVAGEAIRSEVGSASVFPLLSGRLTWSITVSYNVDHFFRLPSLVKLFPLGSRIQRPTDGTKYCSATDVFYRVCL